MGRRTVRDVSPDKYNSFLDNRVVVEYYSINVSTPQGLETLKHWLNDHGEGAESGGLANFACYMEGANYDVLPPECDDSSKKDK